MSEGITIDVESVARFRLAARRLQDRIDGGRRMVPYAGLAPGAFTRTAGGHLCDESHAELVSCAGDLLTAAGELLGALADLAGWAADGYQGTDAAGADAITDAGSQPEKGHGV